MSYGGTFDEWPKEFRGSTELFKLSKPKEWYGAVRIHGDDMVIYRDRDPIWSMELGPQTQLYMRTAIDENLERRLLRLMREHGEWWDKESRLEGK